jgi:hypothetical protein
MLRRRSKEARKQVGGSGSMISLRGIPIKAADDIYSGQADSYWNSRRSVAIRISPIICRKRGEHEHRNSGGNSLRKLL